MSEDFDTSQEETGFAKVNFASFALVNKCPASSLRMSKLLINFHFWVNYSFNCFKHQHNLDGVNFQNYFELQINRMNVTSCSDSGCIFYFIIKMF